MSTGLLTGTRHGSPGRPAGRPAAGGMRIRRALVVIGCGILILGLSACESTEQESAKIGRESEGRQPARSEQAGRAFPHAGHEKEPLAHEPPRRGPDRDDEPRPRAL